MADIGIPWSPRVVLTGRNLRLPVQVSEGKSKLDIGDFQLLDQRWSVRDEAFFYYLEAPQQSGDYTIRAKLDDQIAETVIQVRSLDDLRQPHPFNGVYWPRRWPVGQDFSSTKERQTLQDLPVSRAPNEEMLGWWTTQDDEAIWRQLPSADYPRAHYTNVHQGCPNCGTAIFSFGGFYPWKRQHYPYDMRSECPSCAARFPSNDLAAGDFSSGDFVDDGYGYFDAEGHVFLFAAAYCRDLVGLYNAPIDLLTNCLRTGPFDAALARRLGLLLLRYAVEEIYLAAVPQFRHGPSQEVEQAWDWGQPDWAAAPDPIAALYRKGSLRYSIDVSYIGISLALAYDTIWPFIKEDQELVERAQAQGLSVNQPADVVALIEEMLASVIQCCIDGGAVSNLPRVSVGVLVMLRCLERSDAQDVLTWLYDRGPAKMRVFTTNNFTVDGTPPEATGGYNNTHTEGLFDLEYHMRQLRQVCPGAYPETQFPSLLDDERVPRIVCAPYEIALLDKVPFHFGDGGSAGVQGSLAETARLAPLTPQTLEWAGEYVDNGAVENIRAAVAANAPLNLGTTIHDGVGFAILRTAETPERAAAGIVYGDVVGHRHMDLLDVQLYAFNRPFLSDLGYPQSWASVEYWEGNWATHNSVWGIVPGVEPLKLPFDTPWPFMKQIAGRGHLVRLLQADGVQVVEIEAERWAFDEEKEDWYRPGVKFKRLLALVETDGEGVALIDLARVCGGTEHWRICRGLEGAFTAEVGQVARAGTVADENGTRGDRDHLAHPDYAGLACMDEVAVLEADSTWKGAWEFSREAGVYLDLHQLRAPAAAQVMRARATAVMGTPEESRYCYRPLLWKNRALEGESSCIDLVFEPRIGQATLELVRPLAAEGDATASGVELRTCSGREIRLYWAPDSDGDRGVRFADGVEMEGNLAVEIDGAVTVSGVTRLKARGGTQQFDHGRQEGRILALERAACTIEVAGLERIAVGDRIRINPQGRSHSYRVEQVEELAPQRQRLKLDVSSVLGRSPVTAVEGKRLELEFNIPTRTGRLHQARVECEKDGSWTEIVGGMNSDVDCTRIELRDVLEGLRQGEWVGAVTYVVGDVVVCEPICTATI